jgi:predicted glycogen debranching enzyme
MLIDFGREICGNLEAAQKREWLVTNGIGGYSSGTVAGLLMRGYHGLLVAALKPPLERTLLVAQLEEIVQCDRHLYFLGTNRWADGTVEAQGYRLIERFYLEGTIPVWHFACGDALLEKRVWMQPGANTTYVRYHLQRATRPIRLWVKAMVNYRNYHDRTRESWQMEIDPMEKGVRITAFEGAMPFYLLTDRATFSIVNEWYYGFELSAERDRGLEDLDNHLHAVTFEVKLEPQESLTLVASTEANPTLNSTATLDLYRHRERNLIQRWQKAHPTQASQAPNWIEQLVLAADQFIVNRPLPNCPDGKTIIAGYHWFTDWGRDTAISLPGLTLATGRPEIADAILRTFARYVSRGMLPNRFPDDDKPLTDADYNTVDATLWYFEAIRQYHVSTGDDRLLRELFPILGEIIDWHQRETRFNIHLDPDDGLIYAGKSGVQLTWMDAKVGDWVVTPRIGKPVEVNALWYSALRTMSQFAQRLGKSAELYNRMSESTRKGFQRFWNDAKGYCFDVLDGPDGNDDSLRPNQLLAISLLANRSGQVLPLLTSQQQQSIMNICGRSLLTFHGLRSLDPNNPSYQGHYGGDRIHRDGAYHQGTVWGWLLGPYVLAHLAVFGNSAQSSQFLAAIAPHLLTAGLGTMSEIFDGDAPMEAKGCIAQAWSVGEVLRAWMATHL